MSELATQTRRLQGPQPAPGHEAAGIEALALSPRLGDFNEDLRASGIGWAVAASRFGSAVSTFVLPLIVALYGAPAALGACVAVLAIGALACQRWAPETRHVNLQALDQDLGSRIDGRSRPWSTA